MLLSSLAVCAFLVSFASLIAKGTDAEFAVRVSLWYLVTALIMVQALAVYLGFTSNVELYKQCCKCCDERVFEFYENLAVKHHKEANALKQAEIVEICSEQGVDKGNYAMQKSTSNTHTTEATETEQYVD